MVSKLSTAFWGGFHKQAACLEESYRDLAKEHERLVKVLRSHSPSKEDREAGIQAKELKEYRKKE